MFQSGRAKNKPAKIKQNPAPTGSSAVTRKPDWATSSVDAIRAPAPNHVAKRQRVVTQRLKLRPPTKKSSSLWTLLWLKKAMLNNTAVYRISAVMKKPFISTVLMIPLLSNPHIQRSYPNRLPKLLGSTDDRSPC